MPAVSAKQQAFMGAELGRKRAGQKTQTGMSDSQLSDFASNPKKKKKQSNSDMASSAPKRSRGGMAVGIGGY